MYKSFAGFGPYKGHMERRPGGVMIALENGQVTSYSLESLQERGVLFVQPGDKVYGSQVVGESARNQDMVVNPCKAKLDSMRSATKELDVKLNAPRIMTMEEALEYINSDRLVEVTPLAIRIREESLITATVSELRSRKTPAKLSYGENPGFLIEPVASCRGSTVCRKNMSVDRVGQIDMSLEFSAKMNAMLGADLRLQELSVWDPGYQNECGRTPPTIFATGKANFCMALQFRSTTEEDAAEANDARVS